MYFRRITRLLSAGVLLTAALRGDEVNFWPFYVGRSAEGTTAASAEYLGPLIFRQTGPVSSFGLRPILLETQTREVERGTFLYPFFNWTQRGEVRSANFFQLVNSRTDTENPARPDHRFDVWPVYFSREASDPGESYQAFFPLGGTIRNRLGKDRINFVLFPLYAHTEKNEKQVTHTPWPFFRRIYGGGHHGFEIWPLYGQSAHSGDYDRQYFLWPLLYRSATYRGEETPDVKLGVLPFYARDTGPGYISETYGWPFFGYTHRTVPYRYDEQRYLWPFFVQGRGDDRRVNRWSPFYTHSEIKGLDKTWVLWPLYRQKKWQADRLAQAQRQFLLFIYWSLKQQSLANPAAAAAHKIHLWPLFSAWDNGAGHRQVQALSPMEPLFQHNATVRQLWSPLFALYRYERNPDRSARHAWLWNAVTYRHSPAAREFHLGPLLSVHADSTRRRFALGNGVIGLQRRAGERWRLFLFDFQAKATMQARVAPSP